MSLIADGFLSVILNIVQECQSPLGKKKNPESISRFAASRTKLAVLYVIWELAAEFSHGIILT